MDSAKQSADPGGERFYEIPGSPVRMQKAWRPSSIGSYHALQDSRQLHAAVPVLRYGKSLATEIRSVALARRGKPSLEADFAKDEKLLRRLPDR